MRFKDVETVEERRAEKKIFAKQIGKHLRAVRKRRGYSQEKLSLNAGYSTTFVSKIETGLYSPSMHTIWRLARTMNLSVVDFLRGFDNYKSVDTNS